MGYRFKFVIIFLLCLCVCFAAQGRKKPRKASDEKVYLDHSDELRYNIYSPSGDAQVVKGHVKFTHNGGHLTCDSAYFYQQLNSVRAFGHVHYWQGDTLSLTCDRGHYDGQIEMMEGRSNVVLRHHKRYLYTDSLNYDRLWENAYFFDGGKLIDGKDKLRSDWGNYNLDTKEATFYYDVVMLSGGTRCETDTLRYDTRTKLAKFFGKSVIHDGEKTIVGDSLYTNSDTGHNEGFGNVVYTDPVNKHQLLGDHLFYNKKTGYGFATKKALLRDYSQGKDTLFVHADSLKLYTYNMDTDSLWRKVHAFRHVKAYRQDVQGICDSLVIISRDSMMVMYHDPIAWYEQKQVKGDSILVYFNDSTVRDSYVMGHAFSIEKCDEENHYNQISSTNMHTIFLGGNVRQNTATENVLVIFYPVDEEDSSLMLLNYMETDTMHMFITPQRQLEKLWTNKANGVMYPMSQIPPEKYHLEGFAWLDELRPIDKDDIFVWRNSQNPKPNTQYPTPNTPTSDGHNPATSRLGR